MPPGEMGTPIRGRPRHYATPARSAAKWGDTEIARLSATADAEALVVDAARCRTAIADAEALVDSYLRVAAGHGAARRLRRRERWCWRSW